MKMQLFSLNGDVYTRVEGHYMRLGEYFEGEGRLLRHDQMGGSVFLGVFTPHEARKLL